MGTPNLSVILFQFGYETRRFDNFLEVVTCLQRQTYPFELIIIEQTAGNKPVYANVLDIPHKYIRVEYEVFCNSWIKNIAAKQAKGNTLAYIDGDVIIADDYLEKVMDAGIENYAIWFNKTIYLNEIGRARYCFNRQYKTDWYKSHIEVIKKPSFHTGAFGLVHFFNKDFFS